MPTSTVLFLNPRGTILLIDDLPTGSQILECLMNDNSLLNDGGPMTIQKCLGRQRRSSGGRLFGFDLFWSHRVAACLCNRIIKSGNGWVDGSIIQMTKTFELFLENSHTTFEGPFQRDGSNNGAYLLILTVILFHIVVFEFAKAARFRDYIRIVYYREDLSNFK